MVNLNEKQRKHKEKDTEQPTSLQSEFHAAVMNAAYNDSLTLYEDDEGLGWGVGDHDHTWAQVMYEYFIL